ncbi:MAG: hypothetical protein E7265_11290 [Lachnospiraceae bacterium]|nr:hypothetical protein [Lachnospiraceae bacterium]
MKPQNTAINQIAANNISLNEGELIRRRNDNREYLMSLTTRNLMYNYELEAALTHDACIPEGIHGGWESPTCQLRGHFLGHWLSAAAMLIADTNDKELKAKADTIIERLAACQEANGGRWVASIPEKYLYRIADGKGIWAPHYTLHKTFMGLVDMYRFTGNETALTIADNFADWFLDWSEHFNREQLDNILDFETGGMLEIWVQLYDITGKDKYKTLMDRYYRGRLFDSLLNGEDPLTNMHANTTIPEILGAACAYEVTGDSKYKDIVMAYWKEAVTDRGMYATGGQTNGEIWGPKNSLNNRLGMRTQEHCTVYNMMRLADYMFRWTGEACYADYIERNLYNGVMAQTYWHWEYTNGYSTDKPTEGLIAYFLPMKAGAHKGWGSRTDSFYCCHGSMVQANSILNNYIYYQKDNEVYVNQYHDSEVTLYVNGNKVQIIQRRDPLTGSFHLSSTSNGKQTVNRTAAEYPHNPDTLQVFLQIKSDTTTDMTVKVRIPWWITKTAIVEVNNEKIASVDNGSCYVTINRSFSDGDVICVTMHKGITTYPLPDNNNMVAFMYGPEVLAGLCDDERTLYYNSTPDAILVNENEREWGSWKSEFRTLGQPQGIHFVPINKIGHDNYCIYFPIEKK